jgi:hypothetical protein
MADRFVSTDLTGIDVDSTDPAGIRSQADDGIVAQLHLRHPELVLQPAIQRAPAITIEPDYWTNGGAGRTLLFFTAYGPAFDDFETALGFDRTVEEPILLEQCRGRRSYRVELTDRALTLVEETAIAGGQLRRCSGSRGGWQYQLRFPGRDALVAFNAACRERDVSVSVEHLRLPDEQRTSVLSLTEKQQELLAVAYEEGYFEVPRRISQDELADRLGVSKSAVSQRLRRAIGELCASSFA